MTAYWKSYVRNRLLPKRIIVTFVYRSFRVMVMSTIASYSPLNISETVRDGPRGLVPKDHCQKFSFCSCFGGDFWRAAKTGGSILNRLQPVQPRTHSCSSPGNRRRTPRPMFYSHLQTMHDRTACRSRHSWLDTSTDRSDVSRQ